MKKLSLILAMLLLPFVAMRAQTAGENFDVTHYGIHLWDFDFTNHRIQGETYVTLNTSASTNTFVLELKSLMVSDVSCVEYDINVFEQDDENDLLIIITDQTVPAGTTLTLDIEYYGFTFSESWGGVEWWGEYVYNLGVGLDSQPHNLGKSWFPCVDDFTDKAVYDVFITATNDKKAICGGNLVETIDNGDGTTTWHWNTPQEIATYHISFAVGNYERWEDVYHGIERDIPIEVYAKPGQMGSVPGTFIHIQEICSTLEQALGPYPFNRIGYVCTGKGCMEHTDNIALATSIFSGNTDNEEYLAHELSHMWSGNLVTCAEAGDMWLNEGFAQFWGVFYRVGVYGEEDFQNAISAKVNAINSWCNNSNNWMPLNNIPLDMTYNTNAVYERGAVIVNTMMNYMGRENFLSSMRQYFDQYAYQAATSEQLRDALTQYSGINMDGFFDTYVFASGMPHLYATIASVVPVGNQYRVQLDLRYQHIGDAHIGQDNAYDVTFIGPEFQLATERVNWDGLHGSTEVILDFEPLGMMNDFNNNWLDGKTQKNMMIKNVSSPSFAYFTAQATSVTDSVFVSVENHLVGPYDDPLIPNLNLSSKHFWTVNRFDFGEAKLSGMFDYSRTNDGDIIQSANDSATLLYRSSAVEPWHEIPYTLYPGSIWRQGRFVVDDLRSGEYAVAAWNKEALSTEEHLGNERTMQVFPNPASGSFRVVMDESCNGQIRILSADGKELRRLDFIQAKTLEISTEGLPKGCHTLIRLNKNGEIKDVEKLIIK